MRSGYHTDIVKGVSEPDLSGTVLDGRYQIVEPIAEGAMGSVYRGERLKLGRAVAIKILHEALPDELASRQRFEREAKLMARLEHPNCVSVIDFGVHDDKPFLVMELVRGTSLLQVLERENRLEAPRAADIMRQVLSGLAHAHELGIVHRDVKPANIMVGEKTGIGLQVRLLDFGLARFTDTSTKLTTGIVVGTPNYMAPEQCKGSDIDGRADLYACGVILFEMLTGKKPFTADDPIHVVRKHMTQPPPRLAEMQPTIDFGDFEQVVARALAKEPAGRFQSAQDMTAAIDAALATRKSLGHAVPQVMARASSKPQIATDSGWAVPPSMRETVVGQMDAGGPTPEARGPEKRKSLPPLPEPHLPDTGATTPDVTPPLADARGPKPGAPKLPFTRKQMAIAGGGLLGVILLVAIFSGGRSSSSTATPGSDTPVTHASGGGEGDPVPGIIAQANDMLANGERERALSILVKARRDFPQNAQLAFTAGKVYFAKLYWTDGISSFRDAIRLDPSYRNDPELIKAALRGFITTPGVERDLESFLREDIGEPAIPFLEETARDHPNPTIRARATNELRRFR
jgi:serine/threonine-protein kinase